MCHPHIEGHHLWAMASSTEPWVSPLELLPWSFQLHNHSMCHRPHPLSHRRQWATGAILWATGLATNIPTTYWLFIYMFMHVLCSHYIYTGYILPSQITSEDQGDYLVLAIWHISKAMDVPAIILMIFTTFSAYDAVWIWRQGPRPWQWSGWSAIIFSVF